MSKRVLIIEDDSSVAEMVAEVLGKMKFQTDTAGTGNDGLRLFTTQKPDIVLLDIALPDINGFEIAKQIRAQEGDQHTHIIIMTAYAQSFFVSKGFEASIDGYLNKPLLPQDLEFSMRDLQ
jgi:two-component system response regulator MtrA